MGWIKSYENALITVWDCDTCNLHTIIQHKRTGKELWVDKEGMTFKKE